MNPKVVNSILLAGFYAGIMALGDAGLWSSPKFYILWVVGVLALVYQPAFEKFDRGTGQDRGTAMQILWTIQLTQIAGILEAVFLRYPESFGWAPWAWVGVGLMVAGLGIRSWAVIHLGKAFTWHIDPGQADGLITSGPYSVVRHPSYTGAYLLYTGTLVFVGAWYALPACMVGMVLAFVRRIRHEEAALEAKFGNTYIEYRQRVSAVVPGL